MPRTIFALSALLAAAALNASAARAESVADVYKDRTVTLVFGYSAGGTYGQTSLLLSQFLGRHIPGNPNVIIQSMPGAGGIKMTNYAAHAMPRTGLFIMMPPEMIIVSQLLRPKKVKYVTKDFYWLGTVFGSNQIMCVRRDTGIKSIADLRKKQIIVASTGAGSPTYLVPAMMNGVVGTKFKIVTGYKGSAATTLSVERGETFGMTNSWVSWKKNRGSWFRRGNKSFLLKLAQIGYNKEPDLPHLPLLTELARTPDDKAAAALLSTASVIGRGLATPPGVPERLAKALRTAFWDTVTDPAFKAEGKKRKLPIVPIKGAEVQKVVDEATSMSPTAIAKARKYAFGK